MPPLVLALALTAPAQPPGYPVPVLTLDQFSRVFTPVPGRHEVLLVHPKTGQPVAVCFTLPEGKLRHFEVTRNEIEFDFGRTDVEIIFRHNGTVDVKYHR